MKSKYKFNSKYGYMKYYANIMKEFIRKREWSENKKSREHRFTVDKRTFVHFTEYLTWEHPKKRSTQASMFR